MMRHDALASLPPLAVRKKKKRKVRGKNIERATKMFQSQAQIGKRELALPLSLSPRKTWRQLEFISVLIAFHCFLLVGVFVCLSLSLSLPPRLCVLSARTVHLFPIQRAPAFD